MQVIACEEQFVNDIRKARTLRLISAIAKLESDSFLSTANPFPCLQTPKTVPGASIIFGNAKSTPGAGFGQSAVPSTSGGSSAPGGLFGSLNTPVTTASETAPKTTSLFSNITPPKTDVTITTTFKTLAEFAKDNQEKLAEVLTNERQIVYEIHDIMKAYYNISVQNYTDMVCKNELNDTFVKETMNVFSKTFIDRLSESKISSIAAESPTDRKKRRELKEDIEKLEMAIRESEKILEQAVADYE